MKKLLILLGLCPLLVHGTKYYISSSTGNNGNNGTTPTTPLQSIVWLNGHFTLHAGDSVFLKSGDVFAEPLILNFSGNATSHIVFSTYNGSARAVINGFFTLSGGTQIPGTNIYEFFCPGLTQATNMLVMDGVVQPMGRWPDHTYRQYYHITSTSITDSLIPASPNWAGAWLVAHTEYYIIDTALIQSQSGAGLISVDALSATNIGRGNGYFVENDPRTLLLDSTAGRWYNNYTKDSMEVLLPAGPSGHTLQVPTLDSLCYFNRHAYNDIYNIDFEGSNGADVLLNVDTAFTMTNCIARYGARNGIQANETRQATLLNDTLDFFQNNGITVTGSTSLHCLVKNVQIDHCGLWPGMGSKSGGNGNASYTGCNWPLGFNTFQNTTILNSGYTGLCYAGDSVNIVNCVVDTFCLTKIDGGGFYTEDGSFVTYTYGRFLNNCLALYGQNIPMGVPGPDTTDASFGFYCDSHSQSVTLSGCTGAYNTSGGLFIHGSKITSRGNNYFGNRWVQRIVAEASGIPISGLSLTKDQLSTDKPGQLLSVVQSPTTDMDAFGTIDSNYYAKTDTAAFRYQYNNGTPQTVSFPTWQRLTGYDAHSTFLSVPTTFVYNTGSVSAAETFPMSNLAGSSFSGSAVVPAFGSLILYLLAP